MELEKIMNEITQDQKQRTPCSVPFIDPSTKSLDLCLIWSICRSQSKKATGMGVPKGYSRT